MRLAQYFPHSPLITFRAQKVHVMSGECELRDIALLVFGGNGTKTNAISRKAGASYDWRMRIT